MTALTIGVKVRRTLTFLTGLTHPRIATSLAPHGFDQTTLAEGWDLLTKVTGARLGRTPAAVAARIVQWELRRDVGI